MNSIQIKTVTDGFNHSIRDPLWSDINLTEGYKKLFYSYPMQKLTRIKQLGPAYLLYPGAVHSRSSHSLGVYHLTRLIIISLLNNSSTLGVIPHFKPKNIKALLAAAMLHDLGHFPYAHALKDVVTAQHEQLGASFIKENSELISIIENDIGTSVDAVVKIIDEDISTTDEDLLFFRTILSGTLDPDKLDYLNRDAHFCGVLYGSQDVSYIIRNLVYTQNGKLAIPIEAMSSVEHLLFAKYSMYKSVYWHKTTRCATAMIKKALLLALEENLFSEKELYDLDDESFKSLFDKNRGTLPEILFTKVRDNKLLSLKQTFDLASLKEIDNKTKTELELILLKTLIPYYPNLNYSEVILDIPEKISFEADIPILDSDGSLKPFNEVNTLFTKEVVATFVCSLRKGRLFLPNEVDSAKVQPLLNEVLSAYGR